jgi:hypothetical protein
MVQVLEYLTSKCEALSSNRRTTKKGEGLLLVVKDFSYRKSMNSLEALKRRDIDHWQ